MQKRTLTAVLALALLLSGCVSTGGMSYREQTTFTGAALGGVAGAVVTEGSVFGTLGGVAIGGVIGHHFGNSRQHTRHPTHYRHDRRGYVQPRHPRSRYQQSHHPQRRFDQNRHEPRRHDGRRHDGRGR